MKTNILLILSSVFFFIACSDDKEDWEYGDKQVLPGTEWTKVGDFNFASANETFSPIRFSRDQTLRFEQGSFTMTTRGSIYDEGLHAMRDTTFITGGSYQYEHPTLRMTPESGSPTVEAWITPLNRICFYDNRDFYEFKKK